MLRASTAGSAASNKRYVLLAITLGLIGAVLVYASFSRTPSSVVGGGDTPVVVAKTDIPARAKITQAMVEVKLVGADALSDLSYTDLTQVVGQVTRFPIAANEQVLSSKVVPLVGTSLSSSRSLSYVVPAGKRALAVNFSEVQGAGGLVLPGDYVDILVVYDVTFAQNKADAFLIQTLLQNIEVLAISQTVVDVVPEATPSGSGQRVRNSEAKADPAAKSVTLAVTPEQAQRLYLAEQNGLLRLSVRPYGDGQELPIQYMTENDLLPRDLPQPIR